VKNQGELKIQTIIIAIKLLVAIIVVCVVLAALRYIHEVDEEEINKWLDW